MRGSGPGILVSFRLDMRAKQLRSASSVNILEYTLRVQVPNNHILSQTLT